MNPQWTIWKYELSITDRQTVMIPAWGRILSVQMQKGVACLWVLVNPENEKVKRHFAIYGTGHPVKPPGQNRQFVGTIQLNGGDLVFHVFEE
jgi:hypothetical protein